MQLDRENGTVPVERKGGGGGLTSFGDAVLLLTHEGKIFAARSATRIDRTNIEAPENGFSAYVKVAESERYRDYQHSSSCFATTTYSITRLGTRKDLRRPIPSSMIRRTRQKCGRDPWHRSGERRRSRFPPAGETGRSSIGRARACPQKGVPCTEGHMAGGRIALARPPQSTSAAAITIGTACTLRRRTAGSDKDTERSLPSTWHRGIRDCSAVTGTCRASRSIPAARSGSRSTGFAAGPTEPGSGGRELRMARGNARHHHNRLPIPNTRSYGRHDTFTAPALPGFLGDS